MFSLYAYKKLKSGTNAKKFVPMEKISTSMQIKK